MTLDEWGAGVIESAGKVSPWFGFVVAAAAFYGAFYAIGWIVGAIAWIFVQLGN